MISKKDIKNKLWDIHDFDHDPEVIEKLRLSDVLEQMLALHETVEKQAAQIQVLTEAANILWMVDDQDDFTEGFWQEKIWEWQEKNQLLITKPAIKG